jgi:beta-glucosidase
VFLNGVVADRMSLIAQGVSGGCDADCPGGSPPVTYFGGIAHAIQSGMLPVEMVDQSLTRVFTAAISLGLLDDPTKSPYAHLDDKDLDTPRTRSLNLEAAIQSMTLLKNQPVAGKPVLPIAKGSKLAIIGPHFNSTQDLLSDYSPGHWWAHSPLFAAEAMAKAGEISLVGSAQGCDLEGNSTAGFAAAIALAKSADVPVVFVGLTPNNDKTNSGTPPVVGTASALESEGHDRTDIDLQGQQLPLIKALVAANPKTVVVLIHGGAVDISWSRENVAAILDA